MKKIQLTPSFVAHYIKVGDSIHFTVVSETVVMYPEILLQSRWIDNIVPTLVTIFENTFSDKTSHQNIVTKIVKAPMSSDYIVVVIIN